MKRIMVFCLCIFASFLLLSCGNNKSKSKNEKSTAADFSEENLTPEKKWTNEEGCICIVFGYGFNDQAFYSQSIEKLAGIYGLNAEGGLLYPMLFPDDFKNGSISDLKKSLDGVRLKGMILLGAPDDTHHVLAKYQESYGGEIPFPVISLFPQDNVLGQESTCSLIIDNERTAVEDTTSNEIVMTTSTDAEEIFLSTVDYVANLKGKMLKGSDIKSELKEIVEKIVGPGKIVRRYVDRGSRMESLNHYTVESR